MKKKRSTPREDISSEIKGKNYFDKKKRLLHTEYSSEQEFSRQVLAENKEEAGHGSGREDDDDDDDEDDKVKQDDDEDDDDENDKVVQEGSKQEDDDNHDKNVKVVQKGPSNQPITYGFHLVRGEMDHGMEDYIVADTRKIDGHELGLYAIFDGHSGREVAEYLQSHLFENILSEPDFWRSPKCAIRRAYKVTEDEILDKVVGRRGGSTVVTAILIDREKLVVANVGDSRGITVDHEPKKERDLVESKGGFVTKMPGNVPRVDGQLAMTRAFGDRKLKNHITSEPDVIIDRIDKTTEFVILASDGLGKVMSNQEASDCIKGLEDAQEASEELIKEAL